MHGNEPSLWGQQTFIVYSRSHTCHKTPAYRSMKIWHFQSIEMYYGKIQKLLPAQIRGEATHFSALVFSSMFSIALDLWLIYAIWNNHIAITAAALFFFLIRIRANVFSCIIYLRSNEEQLSVLLLCLHYENDSRGLPGYMDRDMGRCEIHHTTRCENEMEQQEKVKVKCVWAKWQRSGGQKVMYS